MSNQFKAEVFQNQFLPECAKEVHAIMTVSTAPGMSIEKPIASGTSRLFGIICDTSGSMGGGKIQAAKEAIIKIINLLPEDSYFFIVTGASKARVIFPVSLANKKQKQIAIDSVKSGVANGGTLMSTWLTEALQQFQKMPNAIRQALLLTDSNSHFENKIR